MSDESKKTCPVYYQLAGGREFWQFYLDVVEPNIREFKLHPSAQHALESACEYVFRNGFKGNEYTSDVYRKVYSLIERIYKIQAGDELRGVENAISIALGRTVAARAHTEANRK